MYKKIRDEGRRTPSQPPERVMHEIFEEEEEDEEEEQELPVLKPPPPPVVKPKIYQFRSDLDAYKTESAVEKRKLQSTLQKKLDDSNIVSAHYRESAAYHAKEKVLPSRALRLLSALKSNKDMVILHEIMSAPRARRPL